VPIERFLTVPVVTANRPVGQIALANPGRDYTDQDLRAVERLGGLYGLALQRHRMEQEREKLQNQLLRVQKLEAVGTLARGIAHDFNNILGAILGHSQMIPERLKSGQDVAENAEQISKACLRARDLVRQILSFSRNGNPERRPINIGHVVKEALRLVQSSVSGFIDVRYLIPADIDPAMADPSQIHQVVMNLCTNARDAMEEKGGTLEVSLAQVDLKGTDAGGFPNLLPGRYARLLVRDTGDGMDKATLAQIFDPFFTTKEVGKGTGLGLAVVHGIVKSHGGGIAVSSAPGQGSTFSIMLPLMEKSADPDDEPREPVVKGSGRVLIVDDEKGLAQIVERMLVYLGYQAVSRTCPQEALDLIKKDPRAFDLLLTDLTMPVMTGERLAGEVRAIRPDLPVIICTGYGEQTVQLKLTRFGDAQVLLKPVEMRDLAAALRRALPRPAGS
jgi:signal transduction histidine kinase/ActR/RegA family two-component response regulator